MSKQLSFWLMVLFILTVSTGLYAQDQQKTEQEPQKTETKETDAETEPATTPTETTPAVNWYEGENLRAIVGYEQADASSAQSKLFLFTNLYFSRPFPIQFSKKNTDKILGPKLRMWGNIMVTSVPQAGNQAVSSVVSGNSPGMDQLTLNEVAQAIEFMIGLDYRLLDFEALSSNYRYTINVIAGCGVITPLSPKSSLKIYEISPELEEKYKFDPITGNQYDYTGMQYAAVADPIRNRFYRQYFAGFRFKTFTNPDKYNGSSHFPAMLDITYGLNDSVTGGHLDEGVLRLDLFFPLKISKNLHLYLFANTQLLLSKTHTQIPIFLAPAPDGTKATDPGVIVITSPPQKSEHYRIGLGVDLVKLFKK